MKSGGRLTASLVLMQLFCAAHSVRRPSHAAVAAFDQRSGHSYSVSRVTTWCPDEHGNMRKVEKEVQKRGLFDGEKWRSGTTVTEWHNGQRKTRQVEGDPELSKFPLPRTNLQRSLMGDMFLERDPFFEMEDMLEHIYPSGFFRSAFDDRMPTLRTRAGAPIRGAGYSTGSYREDVGSARETAVETEPAWRQKLRKGWDKVRESASALFGKAAPAFRPGFIGWIAGQLRQGWRKLTAVAATGAVTPVAELETNSVCDTEAPGFQSASKTVEFWVNSDGKMRGSETFSQLVDGEYETVERPLEPEIVEGFRAERARRMAAEKRRAATGTAEAIDAEVESKS